MTASSHPDDRVADLHEHLAATAELPVDRTANRWIGEAEAVAEDLVGANVDHDVLRERIGHVAELLSNVEDTGDPRAEEHIDAATEITEEILGRLDD